MNANMDTNIANQIVLTKESTENQIKTYFQKVLELKQSNDEFPIDFDETWMLVYEDRKSAIRELKDKFIQDIVFVVLLLLLAFPLLLLFHFEWLCKVGQVLLVLYLQLFLHQ